MLRIFFRFTGTLALLLILIPQGVLAAELLFKVVPNSEVSNGSLIDVFIDPQSDNLNVVEGTIKFSGVASDGMSIQVENGQSILPIWPIPPEYNNDKKAIVFTGGIPNGFTTEGLLFRLSLSPSTSGNLAVSFTNGNAYLNDGKGTVVTISSIPLEIYVSEGGINNTNDASSGLSVVAYVIIFLLTVAVLLIIKNKYDNRKR